MLGSKVKVIVVWVPLVFSLLLFLLGLYWIGVSERYAKLLRRVEPPTEKIRYVLVSGLSFILGSLLLLTGAVMFITLYYIINRI